jgi:hypothetical protein
MLCILASRTLGGQCVMKRKNFRRTVNDGLLSQVEDGAASDDIDDSAAQRASADFYEMRTKMWTNFTRGDIWIAIGLYLVLASVAFVVV